MTPRLIHPVTVALSQISRGATVYDQDTREPIGDPVRETSVEVQGQVRWGASMSAQKTAIGVVENADGSVLFMKADLATAGITIARGDRFTEIGGEPVSVYVVRLEPCAHVGGKATMIRAHFADRAPSQE